MFRSTSAYMADDVTIRCRMRRSHLATKEDFGAPQEMTCTLRRWEARGGSSSSRRYLTPPPSGGRKSILASSSSKSEPHGPELLLTCMTDYISTRDDSPQRRQNYRRRVSPTVQHTIPISDIMVVDTYNARYGASAHKLHVTTLSDGLFELDCLHSNGHDILLAFLQASLPRERILNGGAGTGGPGLCKSFSSCSTTRSMDVDALTARHLQGRLERETWPEKISRRINKVALSLQEISGSFCEAACCRERDIPREMDEFREDAPPPPPPTAATPPSPTRASPRMEFDYASDNSSACSPKKRSMNTRMPSGLSVEPDPEFDTYC